MSPVPSVSETLRRSSQALSTAPGGGWTSVLSWLRCGNCSQRRKQSVLLPVSVSRAMEAAAAEGTPSQRCALQSLDGSEASGFGGLAVLQTRAV